MKKCNKNNYVLFDLLNPAMTAGLDKNAEILVRRMLDLLWISETGTFPNDEEKIFLAVGKGFTRNKFEKARDEAFPLFYVTDDYDYIYCDVAVRRWQDFTGQQAVLESTGEKFDDIPARQPDNDK